MISQSEVELEVVRKVEGWIAAIVRGCLECMVELGDESLDVWLEAEVSFVYSLFSLSLNQLIECFSL